MNEALPSSDNLTLRTGHAVQWRFGGAAMGGVGHFVVGVWLARLLTPDEFGRIALTYVVVGLLQPLSDFGAANALVQREHITTEHIRAAFTFSTVTGMILGAIAALSAPWEAALVGDSRLVPLIRTMAVIYMIRNIGAVGEALLRRRLDFKSLAWIDVSSYLGGFGIVAIAAAYLGYGVWSLVAGEATRAVMVVVSQIMIARHPLSPLIAWRELADLLEFGAGSALSACANYLAVYGDDFVVGRYLGATSLGLYRRAYNLMKIPHTYVAVHVARVMFPVFSRRQADVAASRNGYLVITRLTATLAAPAMGLMIVVAPHFIPLVYGDQWAGAVLPLQILCVAGYFRALYHLGGAVAQSVGFVYRELWRQLLYALLIIVATAVAARWGLLGVAVAVSMVIAYMFLVTAALANQATTATWRMYFRVQRTPLITAVATTVVALITRIGLERFNTSSLLVTGAATVLGSIPWAIGLAKTLNDPAFELFRGSLPRWTRKLLRV